MNKINREIKKNKDHFNFILRANKKGIYSTSLSCCTTITVSNAVVLPCKRRIYMRTTMFKKLNTSIEVLI